MKITIEFSKKETNTIIDQSISIMSEMDMDYSDRAETVNKISKAFDGTSKIKSNVYYISYANNIIEMNFDDKFVCRFIKKYVMMAIGMKSLIKAIIEMSKSWLSGVISSFSDMEDDIGDVKVWVNGKEVGASDEESNDGGDDINTNKDDEESKPKEIKTEFEC